MIERVFGRCKEKNGFQWSFIRERSLKKIVYEGDAYFYNNEL
ncbi:hypothetical protein [Niallia circulans]|nr:hypothetical protein [Niallia circulans]